MWKQIFLKNLYKLRYFSYYTKTPYISLHLILYPSFQYPSLENGYSQLKNTFVFVTITLVYITKV
jgi:hypothetical protein